MSFGYSKDWTGKQQWNQETAEVLCVRDVGWTGNDKVWGKGEISEVLMRHVSLWETLLVVVTKSIVKEQEHQIFNFKLLLGGGLSIFWKNPEKGYALWVERRKMQRDQAGNAPDSGEVEFLGLLVNASVNFRVRHHHQQRLHPNHHCSPMVLSDARG